MAFNTGIPPESSDLEARLFTRMKIEFGDRGLYAVKMLKTAKILLSTVDQAPYRPAAAAYCIRQAVEEIFPKPYYNQNLWKEISDKIVKAHNCIADKNNPTPTEISSLNSAVNELKVFKTSDNKQKVKIKKFIESKTRRNDQSSEYLVAGYKDLITELNVDVHDIYSDILDDTAGVNNYYKRTVDTLTNIILPFWFQDIEQLAKKDKPTRDDSEELNRFMWNHYDLAWFISQMKSPEWLNLMDSDMLKPPSDGSTGLLPYILLNLKAEHLDAFVRLIEENWDEWTKDNAGLCEICHVAYRLGTRGLPFVAKALHSNPRSTQLCHYAWMACRRTDAKDRWIVKLASMLLHPHSALEYYKIQDIAEKLIEGMDRQSCETRINVLVLQLRNNLAMNGYHFSRIGSIADLDKTIPSVHSYLAANLCSALRKGDTLGKPLPSLISHLDPLPQGIRSRFVAWLYSYAGDVDCSRILDFVVSNCFSRAPTGDDVLLLERLELDCNTGIFASRLTDAIGTPPTAEELDSIMQLKKPHSRYRIIKWVSIIGDGIDLVGWEACLGILVARGMKRDGLRRHLVVSTGPTNLFSPAEFDLTKPKDMAGKIVNPTLVAGEVFSNLSISGIRSELENGIKRNPDRWAKDPVEMIKILQHPMYISSYFRALATAEVPLDFYASMLIRSIELASTHPYHVIPLSPPPYYDDYNWENADIAGMELIRELVRNGSELDGESLSRMWVIVLKIMTKQVGGQRETARESINDMEYYLSAYLNYPRPCALHVILFLIQYARKREYSVPEAVWEELSRSLLLTGRIGAEYRAVLATHVGFLCNVLPDWMERNESFLFGEDAPEHMARLSLYMHLMADDPDKGILERYRSGVLDAVRRDIDRAMDFLVQGMLWRIDGYDPESVARSIAEIGPKHISLAGKTVARMLKNYTSQDSIRLGVDFWQHMLDLSPKSEALGGYGWWSYVTVIAQGEWERLMLQTCEQANGKIDLAGEAAERISLSDTVTDSGLRILTLLMQGGVDYLDKELVADYALSILKKSRDNVGIEESRNLLNNVMRDNGYHPDS